MNEQKIILPMAAGPCCGQASGERQEICCPEGQIHEVGKDRKVDLQAETCCGGPPPPRSDPFERPGYILSPYVRAFKQSGADFVPLVKTSLSFADHRGTLRARIGRDREGYTIAPGLYGIGAPTPDSPVIVTANYKLTFDAVRKELQGLDIWLLILDTCGINVWCAAGKKTFSTAELVNRLQITGLKEKVGHRRLILPQLGAAGVSAHEVKRLTGFTVVYGPIRAKDLPRFLSQGNTADETMRRVSFTFPERVVLIPVELTQFCRRIWWILPILLLVSGLGPWIFSLSKALDRGLAAVAAIAAGAFAGAVLMPMLLPWLPGRSFALKGTATGLGVGLFTALLLRGNIADMIGILGLIVTVSSYLAMNFTGSTPFTSPSGVEWEMKRAIPAQAAGLIGSLVLWIASPFVW